MKSLLYKGKLLTLSTHLVDKLGLPKEHGVPLVLRGFLL